MNSSKRYNKNNNVTCIPYRNNVMSIFGIKVNNNMSMLLMITISNKISLGNIQIGRGYMIV
jgi:hypothetical protein